jgi:hypothetical protein
VKEKINVNKLHQSFSIGKLEPSTVDSRLAFLERASARLFLINVGEMELAEAFDGLVCTLQCRCEREMVEGWERDFPPINRLGGRGR